MNNQGKQIWLRRMQTVLNTTIVLFALVLCLPITINWILLCAALLAWVGVLALRAACGEQSRRMPPLALPLLGLGVAAFISGLFNGGLAESVRSIFSFRPLIVYFCAYEAFSGNERLKSSALSILLSLSAVAGFWGTVQQAFNFHPFSFQYLQGTGFLSAPMPFAGQMQFFSLVALAIWVCRAQKNLLIPNNKLFAILLAGNLLGLYSAAERSAWLGFSMGAALILLLTSWRLAAKLTGLACVAFVIDWFADPNKLFQKRLLPLLDWQHDVSTRARLIVWDKAWQEFLHSPIYGIGINKFPHIVIPEALVPGQAKYLGHAHSNYLHMLSTMGIIGLAAYMWLLFSSIVLAAKLYWTEKSKSAAGTHTCSLNGAVALGLLGSLVSLAVAGIFEYNFGTSQVRLAEWFLLGMLTVRKTKN